MLTYKKFSDIGSREVNEDTVGIAEKGSDLCCVLCDGLGGHGKGEIASSFVVDEILKAFRSDDAFIDHLGLAMESVQHALLEEQKKKSAQLEMKTTAVVLVVTDKFIRWAHIGDSRLYMFKKGKYKRRTIDHSVPQMLVLSREIKENEIRNHPDRNKLLRVMGIEWGASSYDLSRKYKKKPGLAFLLCSDGFWELIEEAEMASELKSSANASEWVEKMAAIVKENGKEKNMDNNSAITLIL